MQSSWDRVRTVVHTNYKCKTEQASLAINETIFPFQLFFDINCDVYLIDQIGTSVAHILSQIIVVQKRLA